MKFDRDINPDGIGKYALINCREMADVIHELRNDGEATIDKFQIDWGSVGSDSEFFVLRLKDLGAPPALEAYARYYERYDPEWAAECRKLAERARNHPNRKLAD